MKSLSPVYGFREVKLANQPVTATPTAELRKMSEAKLRARVNELHALIHELNQTALGQPRWWRSIPEVRAEYNSYYCEIRRINQVLKRRQHAGLETTLAPHASAGVIDRRRGGRVGRGTWQTPR